MSLLGIDLGTTGCKAAAFSLDGRCVASAYREYHMIIPQSGWRELSSVEVWEKVKEVIKEVAAQTAGDPVTALSTSSFGEAFVPVTADGKILGDSILCVDDRGGEYVDEMLAAVPETEFFRINPNIPGSNYTMPKIKWMESERPDIYAKADKLIMWADMPAFMFGCGAFTNNSLANRTLLFDVERNDWSDKLLDTTGIDRGKLGEIVPAGKCLGTVPDSMAAELNLPKDVKVVSGGHDQCCNSLGSGCFKAGSSVCGIGTFECITPVFDKIPDYDTMRQGNLCIEHHVLPGLYVSFIYNQACMLVKWFRDTFAAAEAEANGDIYAALDLEMPPEPGNLFALPYFTASGAPDCIADASGVIAGLKTDTTRGEILKAILEGVTYFFVNSLDTLRSMGFKTDEFIATGGGAKSDNWLQIKADILGVPFVRPTVTEGSLLGAAMLAGLGSGAINSPEEAKEIFVGIDRRFEPNTANHKIYREKHQLYRELFNSTYPVLRKM